MSAAIIAAGVSVASLGYSIYNSQQQARMASQAQNSAQMDAGASIAAQQKQQQNVQLTNQRNLALSNERNRVSAPLAAVTTGQPASSGGIGSTPTPSSPTTVTRGSTTLLGS